MESDNDEGGAPADPTQDGNFTESGEASEDDEEQPRKSRKVQRGDT